MLNSLKKKERLKGHKSVQVLFKNPTVINLYPIKLFYKIEKESNENLVLFSVSVSKRNFKKSPDRNKIKRLIREAYRKNKSLLVNKINIKIKLSFMFVYIGNDIPTYNEIEEKVKKILEKISNQ